MRTCTCTYMYVHVLYVLCKKKKKKKINKRFVLKFIVTVGNTQNMLYVHVRTYTMLMISYLLCVTHVCMYVHVCTYVYVCTWQMKHNVYMYSVHAESQKWPLTGHFPCISLRWPTSRTHSNTYTSGQTHMTKWTTNNFFH